MAENIVIANLKFPKERFVNFKTLDRYCKPFLKKVGLNCPSNILLGDLPIGQKQLVAIARALSMDSRIIVMDEPTSSLSDKDVENLFVLIKQIMKNGVSVIYVSHKMDEIFKIADRITVLRDGSYIGTKNKEETDIKQLIKMMVGREINDTRPSRERSNSDAIMTINGLTTEYLRNISFNLREGEVLGIAGLVGAGKSELGAALFGLDKIISGSIKINGNRIKPKNPQAAIINKIALLPEDRKLQGLMMQMNVAENTSISSLSQLNRFGFINSEKELQITQKLHKKLSLKADSHKVAVNTLSGGNQQKVLLAKCLLIDPEIIFLDDPTRGIDIGAKQDIYEIIAELAQNHKGVILVSSELPELLRCCDRIMVFHEGENMGILDNSHITQEHIMTLATGTAAQC